jgi:predicted DNA-binding protein
MKLAKKLTNLRVTDEQVKKLNAESEKTGAPVSEIIRRAIDRYFRKK